MVVISNNKDRTLLVDSKTWERVQKVQKGDADCRALEVFTGINTKNIECSYNKDLCYWRFAAVNLVLERDPRDFWWDAQDVWELLID